LIAKVCAFVPITALRVTRPSAVVSGGPTTLRPKLALWSLPSLMALPRIESASDLVVVKVWSAPTTRFEGLLVDVATRR
jgi:hypothetical protein